MLDGRGAKIIIGNNVDIAQETNVWTLEHDVNDDYHSSSGKHVINSRIGILINNL